MNAQYREPMEYTIDRARQRHLTYEEITDVAHHATRLSLGCDALEAVANQEENIAKECVDHSSGTASSSLIKDVLAATIRQVCLAAAVDDGSRLAKYLEKVAGIFIKANPGSDAVYESCQKASQRVLGNIPQNTRSLISEWLHPALDLLSAAAEHAEKKAELESSVLDEIGSGFPQWNSASDLERKKAFLLLEEASFTSALMNIIGSEKLVTSRFRAHSAVCERATGVADIICVALDSYERAILKKLSPERSISIRKFIKLTHHTYHAFAETSSKQKKMVHAIQERLKNQTDIKDFKDFLDTLGETPIKEIIVNTIMLYPRSTQDAACDFFAEYYTKLNNEQPPKDATRWFFFSIQQVCQEELSSRSLSCLSRSLSRVCQYGILSGELVVIGDDALGKVGNELVSRYPEYFRRHDTDHPYVVRDHQQIVFNAAFCLLPGAWRWTSGRFQVFGEFLAQKGFNKEMMLESFQLLEDELKAQLSGHALSSFMPNWKKIRYYLECVSVLAFSQKKILEETQATVEEKYQNHIKEFKEGNSKVTRDLLTMLHTATIGFTPGGTFALERGLSNFIDNIFLTSMDAEMLAFTYDTLSNNCASQLEGGKGTDLQESLASCALIVKGAAEISPHLEDILSSGLDHSRLEGAQKGAAKAAMRALIVGAILAENDRCIHYLNDALDNYLGMMQRSAIDHEMAKTFADSVFESLTSRALKSESLKSRLDQIRQSIALNYEISAHGTDMVSSAISEIISKYPSVKDKYLFAEEKMKHDFWELLRRSPFVALESGKVWYANVVRTLFHVFRSSRFDPDFILESYNLYIESAKKYIKGPSEQKLLVDALSQTQSVLVVASELARTEPDILRETVDTFYTNNRSRVERIPGVKDLAEKECREILHQAVLMMTSGMEEDSEELTISIRETGNGNHLGQEMITAACGEMEKVLGKFLKSKPSQKVSETLKQTLTALN